MYFKEHKEYLGESGWYVYFIPKDIKCKPICKNGPLSQKDADELIINLNNKMR